MIPSSNFFSTRRDVPEAVKTRRTAESSCFCLCFPSLAPVPIDRFPSETCRESEVLFSKQIFDMGLENDYGVNEKRNRGLGKWVQRDFPEGRSTRLLHGVDVGFTAVSAFALRVLLCRSRNTLLHLN